MGKKMESQHTEFKPSWRDEYLKVLCAFANTRGGTLFVGLDDKGQEIGLNDARRLMEEIPNKARDLLGIIPEVKQTAKGGKAILTVHVSTSSVPISYHGKYYIRSGSTTQVLKGHDLTQFIIARSGRGWDDYVEERSTLKDIDREAVMTFRNLAVDRLPAIRAERNITVILDKLNLLDDGRPKRAAILLFGKNPKKFYPGAFVRIGRFRDETDIISTDEIEGHLFQQVERTVELLRTKYLVATVSFKGIHRRDMLELPETVLREAVINALIHRDYVGAHTQIRILPDCMYIWNEGGLPRGLTIGDLVKSHPSRPRNEMLADVFYKAGLIETWGRGTILILSVCSKAGLAAPIFREKSNGFEVVIKLPEKKKEKAAVVILNEQQRKVLSYIKKHGRISNADYRREFKVSKREATNELHDLASVKAILKIGKIGRGTHYVLSKT